MYMFVRGIGYDSFYDFSIGCWNCSELFFLILLHKFNTGLRSVVYQNKYCINKYNDFQQSKQTDLFHNVLLGTQAMRVWFMVSKATFNNISVILWWSVLLEYTEKTTDLSQVSDKLYHIILYRVHFT